MATKKTVFIDGPVSPDVYKRQTEDELDLLSAFREGQDIKNIITESVASKHFKMGGQFESGYLETSADDVINRSMIKIGG